MTEFTIDGLCEQTTNPTMLNALHACRPNHPLHKTTERPWTSAYFLARQQKSWIFTGAALAWLEQQAAKEGLKLV
jgi:hypothetical protein